MKKIPILLSVLACMMLSLSCSSSNSKEEAAESDADSIVWNERVQETFFGATFGDSISKVIEIFDSKGFYLKKNFSNNTSLHFGLKEGEYFSFGNMSWKLLDVFADNDIFYEIRFMNATKDKATALSNYETIKNAVAAKYSLNDILPQDTTTYARCEAYGKNRAYAIIQCYRYESIGREIWIGTGLLYGSEKYRHVSSEL